MNTNTGNGLYLIDDDYKVLYYNSAVKENFPQIEVGKPCYEVVLGKKERCGNCPLTIEGRQNSLYDPNQKMWIHVQASEANFPGIGPCHCLTYFKTFESAQESDDGIRALNIADTLSRQKHLEDINNTLRKQKSLVDFMNKDMPVGYCRCGTEEGYPFTYISEKFLQMVGYTYEELEEKFENKALNLIHPEDRAFLKENTEAAIKNNDYQVSTQYRVLTKNGYMLVLSSARISEYDGKQYIQCVIIDISEEQRLKDQIKSLEAMKTALNESLAREQSYCSRLDTLQKEILDSINYGVYAYTVPDYKLIVINEQARQMFGCEEEEDSKEGLFRFMRERIVPEDREYVHEARYELKRDGDEAVRNYRAVCGDKTIVIHSTIKYIERPGSQPFILVTMLDVTEQVTLTEKLAKERKAYRDALDNDSEFNFFFDVTEGVITDEFVTAHGFNLIQALGFSAPVSYNDMLAAYVEKFHISFAEENMEKNFRHETLLEEFEKGNRNCITEFFDPVNDLYIRVNCLMYIDDSDGHVYATVVAYDVTEAKKKKISRQMTLKNAYEEMNIRMNSILNSISGGLKIIDIDNDYSYSYLSDGAARLQGYTVDEFFATFGKRATANIYEDDSQSVLNEAIRQADELGSYYIKYRVKHRTGKIKWVVDRGKYIEDHISGRKFFYVLMQDITDSEEQGAKMRDMLKVQEQLSNTLAGGIFAYTLPDRKILMLNREAHRMFELMGTNPLKYGMDIVSKVIPRDLPEMRNAVAQLKEPGDDVEYTFHADTKSKGRMAYKCHTRLSSFENGQRYIISAITDITDNEHSERRLEEERGQYRNALAFGSMGFFNIDLTNGNIYHPFHTKDNKDIMKALGLSVPVSYNKLAQAWFAPERIYSENTNINIVRDRQKLISCFESGTTILNFEYSVIEKRKYYRMMVLLYRIKDHVHATFILYDVTASRHGEKQRMNIINSLGHIFLALYHFSFTEQKCTVLKANDDIAKDLPDICSLTYFYDLYTHKYVMPEYKDAISEFLDPKSIKEALRNEDYIVTEFKRKDLGWCRMYLVISERDKSGEVMSVVAASNIIEQQKIEELAQKEALKAAYESANIASSAKTSFLANMSHDIRTPMNAIIGMTAIAETHLDDKERISDCLSKINISSKHLLGIINDVLDMSKIESGKMELREEEFCLPELIDNLLVMSRTEAAAKNHKLTVNISNIEHENVIGDSQRIQQVFMNIMSNAIKYTPSGGKIDLTISEKSTNKPLIGCYEFIFQDNGIGMSEDFLSQIFEPFSRATGDSRASNVQGTGLGMPITKNIVQMMNGDIKVESRLDEGSKFTVTFFLKLKSSGMSITYENLKGLPVLVADDNYESGVYACALLEEMGMKGEWVQTGMQAVEKSAEHNRAGDDYFAVLVDWKMPDMDGVETVKSIRKKVGGDVKIVIISSYDWSDIELEARAAGADAFISKPLFKSRLLHLFNEIAGFGGDEKGSSDIESLASEKYLGKRALLVEDNPLNSEIAGEILGMAGLEVEYAENGKEALDIMATVKEKYFDIVFMDIQMPIMNGYESTRAIRTLPNNYTKSVPIIAMTANAFAEDVTAAKNAGMNEHIAKPLDLSQLTKVLDKWLG